MTNIQKRLFEMQDLKYRDFHSALMPTVDKDLIIGVRTPLLRSYAKELIKNDSAGDFISKLPHRYYEENNLHSIILCAEKDYEKLITEIERFLPYIDNWATCDITSPKVFKKYTDELMEHIRKWIASDHTYTIRFGIKMLMDFYLDDKFNKDYHDLVASIKSDEYYVKMMIAWYFATALTKQWSSSLPYIENKVMDKWVHNKSIQKAVESYRITKDQKEYLKALRIK